MSTQKRPKNVAAQKSLRVDRTQFEGIVRQLIHSAPVKRNDVQVKNPKNREKLIPPQTKP